MLKFYFIIFLFPLYFSETSISISDFQNVTIPFEEGYCSYTLIYIIKGSSIFKDKRMIIRTTNFDSNQYLFVYDDYYKLKNDKEKYTFENYIYRDSKYLKDAIFEIELHDINQDKTYYITFDSKYHGDYYKDTYDFTFLVYSVVDNSRISQSISFSGKKSNYLFYIDRNIKKFVRLGFKKMTNDVSGELQIRDGFNYQLIHQIAKTNYFEYVLETKYSNRYIFNLTLTSTSQRNDINKIYFYFFKSDENSDDTELIYQLKNKTKEFTVLKELNLLLDILDIPQLSEVYFEYNWEYSYENSIKALVYSDEKLAAKNEEGEELEIVKDSTCVTEKRRCEDFFRKIGGGSKYVVLKILPLNINNKYNIDSYNITIKYGYYYEYSSGLPFYSTLMGIAICVPNIIIHFVNCYKFQKKYFNIVFLFLDLMFWVGFSNVISLSLYIGGYFCYYAGIVILVLYSIAFIVFHIFQLNQDPSGWLYFLIKLCLPFVNDAINKNTVLPPYIEVKAKSFHQESREQKEDYGKDLVLKERLPYKGTEERHVNKFYSEWGRVDQGGGKFDKEYVSTDNVTYEIRREEKKVETWEDKRELKYVSWKDDTIFINEYDEPILKIEFKYQFKLNDDTKNELKKLKSEMNRDGKAHDTEVEMKEDFSIPGFKYYIECRSKNAFWLDLLYLLISFAICSFGFSSLVNFFVFWEYDFVSLVIIKSIASSNIYENPYMRQNKNGNGLNILSNKEGGKIENELKFKPLLSDN